MRLSKLIKRFRNNVVLDKDEHIGFNEHSDQKNTYRLQLKEFAFNSKYQLRVTIKGRGGNDSTEDIFIKKR